MKNIACIIFLFVLFIILASCASQQQLGSTGPNHLPRDFAPSATRSGPRTIILEGDTISEKDFGRFECWYCKDFLPDDRVLVEVGFIDNPNLETFGFILYDGGYSGEVAVYHRTGLEHRWDWGQEGNYAFVIKPDGTGAYYDFSTVPEGETTKPRALYKCFKR